MPTPRLKYEITADDKSASALKGLADSVDNVSSKFSGLATGGVLAGLVALTARVASAADDLGDFAGQIDISTEALSQYQFIAGQAGVSTDTLNGAFAKMVKNVAAAAAGTGDARAALAELGIDAARLKSLAPDQQFEVLAEALSRVKDKGDQARLAIGIFGRDGAGLTRIVQGGAAGVRELRGEVDKLGGTLTKTAADDLSKTADALDVFKLELGVTGRIIAEEFSPTVRAVADVLGLVFVGAAKAAVIAVQTLRGLLLRTVQGVATVLGQSEFADQIGDQAKLTEDSFRKISDSFFEVKSAAATTGVEVDKYIGTSTKLGDTTKAQQAAQKEYNDELAKAGEYFTATRTAGEAMLITLQELDKLRSKGLVTFETYARAGLQAEIAAEEATNALNKDTNAAAEKARADLLAKTTRLYQETRTAAEALEIKQTELNKLYADGAVTFEVYARAGLQAEIAAEEAAGKVGSTLDATQKRTLELIKSIKSSLDQFSNDIVDSFFQAKKGILDILESLGEAIAKSIFKQSVADPLSGAFSTLLGSIFKTGGGGGGGFSNPLAAFGRAKGGPTFDRPFVVGERGPEIISGAGNVSQPGGSVNINFTVNSLDPRTAAAVIVQNRDAIVGVVRGAFGRSGTPVKMA